MISFVKCAIKNQESLYGLYNCGYGSAVSIKTLVEKIITVSGKKMKIEHDLSQPTIKTSLSLNCKKAKKELGWSPNTNLDEGITKTITWWKKNIENTN